MISTHFAGCLGVWCRLIPSFSRALIARLAAPSCCQSKPGLPSLFFGPPPPVCSPALKRSLGRFAWIKPGQTIFVLNRRYWTFNCAHKFLANIYVHIEHIFFMIASGPNIQHNSPPKLSALNAPMLRRPCVYFFLSKTRCLGINGRWPLTPSHWSPHHFPPAIWCKRYGIVSKLLTQSFLAW